MGIRPNTDGYLSRATDLPVNSTGWTMMKWFMMSAQDSANPATMCIVENVGSSYFADVYIPAGGLAVDWEIQAGAAYASQTLFTATAGVWYFVAINMKNATTVELLWRAFGAESLSSSGDITVTTSAWDKAGWLNYTGGTPSANHRAHSARLYHASLSTAEILAESKSPIPVRTSNIDSTMTWRDATDAGDDESGNNRDWTVTGTLATVEIAPVGFTGAPGVVSAAAQSPAVLSTQPVTMGGAVALAAAALNPAITYPVTLGGPVAVSAAVQAPAAASTQPVTMGGPVQVAAAVQSPAVGLLATPDPATASAAVQQPALTSVQPVNMAAAVALSLTVLEPALSESGIVVSGPAPIVLAVPSPRVRDPYPHEYPRRTRREQRRSTMS